MSILTMQSGYTVSLIFMLCPSSNLYRPDFRVLVLELSVQADHMLHAVHCTGCGSTNGPIGIGEVDGAVVFTIFGGSLC